MASSVCTGTRFTHKHGTDTISLAANDAGSTAPDQLAKVVRLLISK